MSTFELTYRIRTEAETVMSFAIVVDDASFTLRPGLSESHPDWARLSFHQCSHCPLKEETSPFCPAAVEVAGIAEQVGELMSYEQVSVDVVMPDRTIHVDSTAQRAISSLLGLVLAISGCPHTAFFRPMARFHLPLSTDQDTLFRSVGMYLIAQYFLAHKHGENVPDLSLDGLKQIYSNLHEVNIKLAQRIRRSVASDTSANAVILLDMLTNFMPFAIEDKLDELEPLFDAYLADNFDEFVRGQFAV